MPQLKVEDVIAYFGKPITVTEHNCWLWLGATDNYGYAKCGNCLIHLWTLKEEGIENPFGTDACHSCPHPNCINPDHFYVGTHKDNMNDDNREKMGPKGRLTEEQIEEINAMLESNIWQKQHIAKKFGVSNQWISKFLRGEFSYAKPRRTSE